MEYIVTNSTELSQALKSVQGGDTILLKGDEVFSINNQSGLTPDSEVTITSYDPEQPATIATLLIANAENLTFDGLVFDSSTVATTRPDWMSDINISGSSNITVQHSTMLGGAESADDTAESLGSIRWCDNVTFSGNTVSGYDGGLKVLDSSSVSISDNDFSKLQGETLSFGRVEGVRVEDNYIHDLLVSDDPMTVIHAGSSAEGSVMEDVVISGNVIIADGEAGVRPIVLGNGKANPLGPDQTDPYYQNVTISENVIYNSGGSSIVVARADDLNIANNTLASNLYGDESDSTNGVFDGPSISVNDTSTNVGITANVAESIFAPEDAVIDANYIVDYDDHLAANYAGSVFVAVEDNNELGLAGLSFDPNGPLAGTEIGAQLSAFDATPEALTPVFKTAMVGGSSTLFEFDASLTSGPDGSVDESDATYEWVLSDGTVLTGQTIQYDFAESGKQDVTLRVTLNGTGQTEIYSSSITVLDPLLLEIDFADGQANDSSSYNSVVAAAGAISDDGVFVTDGASFEIDRSNDQLYDLDQFSISFGMKGQGEGDSGGEVFSLHSSFGLDWTETNELKFTIENDEGETFVVETQGADLSDASWHHVTVSFDGIGGTASIFVDGQELASADVSGSTQAKEFWGLKFGSDWNDSFTGTIDDIVITADPVQVAQAQDDAQVFLASKETGIVVSNSAELLDAMKNAAPGDTIFLKDGGEPYDIKLHEDLGLSSEITITSLDPESPATVTTLWLANASNIVFDGLRFDSSSVADTRADWLYDINVSKCTNITIENSIMEGGATGSLLLTNLEDRAESLASIRWVEDFTFKNNTVTGYNGGIRVLESKNVTLAENDISALQGDPIQMGGVQNMLIEGNYIHDLLGSDYSLNHMDMIQLWSTNTEIVSSDITITGNVLDSGEGVGTQSIFMRNEKVDALGNDSTELFYKNITITDNVIYNGQAHGITVAQTDGLMIANNTIITNKETGTLVDGVQADVMNPQIFVSDVATNVEILNNVTAAVNAPEGAQVEGNYFVEYDNPNAENSVENVFVSAANGGTVGLAGLSFDTDGPLAGAGVGASMSEFDETPEELTPVFQFEAVNGSSSLYQFDASLTADSQGFVDESRASFEWTFEDGTVLNGRVVEHDFGTIGRNGVTLRVTPNGSEAATTYEADVDVLDKVLVSVDFDGGIFEDSSSYQTLLKNDGEISEDGVFVTKGTTFDIDRANDHIYNLDQFSVSFGMKAESFTGKDSVVFALHKSFRMVQTTDNELKFTILSGDGTEYELKTQGAGLGDTDWHRVTLSYDSIGETASIFVDGEELATSSVSGASLPRQFWGITFASDWDPSFTGWIDDIELTSDPVSAEEAMQDSQEFHAEKAAGMFDSSATTDFAQADTVETFGAANDDFAIVDDLASFESNEEDFSSDLALFG